LAIKQGVALARSVPKIDPHLSVGDFTNRAAVLVINTDAVLALFHDTGFVDQEGTIFLTQSRADQQLMLGNERLNRPGAVTDEVLQGANGHPKCNAMGSIDLRSQSLSKPRR
jgi:hypothetical protein